MSKTTDRFVGRVVTRRCMGAGLAVAAPVGDEGMGRAAPEGVEGVEGSVRLVRGHASVFDVAYPIADIMGGYTEVIAPGAFTETLASNADAILTLNHDPMSLGLARTEGGTLRLSEDSTGLAFEADVDLVESDAPRPVVQDAPRHRHEHVHEVPL